jgi:hypothetical protein
MKFEIDFQFICVRVSHTHTHTLDKSNLLLLVWLLSIIVSKVEYLTPVITYRVCKEVAKCIENTRSDWQTAFLKGFETRFTIFVPKMESSV